MIEKLRIIYFILFISTISLKLTAQDKTIDSLKTELKNAHFDTTRVQILSELSAICTVEDILQYAEPCIKLCEKHLASTSRPTTTTPFYLTHLAVALSDIGYLARQHGDISKALEYYHRSLKIQESVNDKSGIGNSLNNIGTIYDSQGDFTKALEYYHRSLIIKEDIKDKTGIATSLNNIGASYNNLGNIPKALEYFEKSLVIREEIKDRSGIAYSLINIGGIYNNQENIPKALEFYNRSLKLQEEMNDKLGIAYSLNNIAGAMLKLGKIDVALKFAIRGMKTSKELGYPENINRAASVLKNIYKKQKQFKGALEMYELEIVMRDSINNEETKKSSIKKQFQYQYEKKAAADSVKNVEEQKVKNAQLTAQQAQLKQEKTQRFTLYGGLVLVVAFLGFVFNRFKVTQKQKVIIEQQKVLVDDAFKHLEEKNKEVMDSIHYAKRIQTALMTNENYIHKQINRLSENKKT